MARCRSAVRNPVRKLFRDIYIPSQIKLAANNNNNNNKNNAKCNIKNVKPSNIQHICLDDGDKQPLHLLPTGAI